MSNSKDENLKLEDLMRRLTEIVQTLEKNEVSLEESLKLYEEGVSITKVCHGRLNEAEKKIQILSRVTPEGIETADFE